MNLTDYNWTDERCDRLRKLWADGLSASQIVNELGGGVTRSAVLGKTHRLKLKSRKRGPSMTPRAIAARRLRAANDHAAQATSKTHRAATGFASKLVRHATAPEPPKVLPKVDVGPDTGHWCTIFQLTNNTCRWPVWTDNHTSGFYCGAPGANLDQAMPYCPAHAARAFNPAARRI